METCPRAPCAITKVLDFTCPTRPELPWLKATDDGAVVAVNVDDEHARILTVSATEQRIEDPQFDIEFASRVRGPFAATLGASEWLFAANIEGMVAYHRTDKGSFKASIAPRPKVSIEDPVLTDAAVVSDSKAYVAYFVRDIWNPHLATWDGVCWHDDRIGDGHVINVVLATDHQGQPWTAWTTSDASRTRTLHLREPSGNTHVISFEGARDPESLRLLTGGLDGASEFPAVAVNFDDGIHVYSVEPTSGSGWQSLVLSEAALAFTSGGDCPGEMRYLSHDDPCNGLTTCSADLSGTGSGFGLTRTQSGTVYAAWVNYGWSGNYSLQRRLDGYEMPQVYCAETDIGGFGIATLVIARLTAAEPVLTHFVFGMDGAVKYLDDPVELSARGDTLLVAAYLNGGSAPTLSYLEIDTAKLQ
jgi:hypothetical protein